MKQCPGPFPSLLRGSLGLRAGAGRRPALYLFKALITVPEHLGDLLWVRGSPAITLHLEPLLHPNTSLLVHLGRPPCTKLRLRREFQTL